MKLDKYFIPAYFVLAVASVIAFLYAIFTKDIYQINIILFILWVILFTIKKILIWKIK